MSRRNKAGAAPGSLLMHSPASPVPDSTDTASAAWLLTFTDLVALMLTFFVMLFAMSQVEDRRWKSLTDALATKLNVVRETVVATPTVEVDIEAVEQVAGLDLDYLASLLRQHIAEDTTLAEGLVSRQDDRLVISFPGDLLFAPGSTALSASGSKAVGSLGFLLDRVGNAVEVAGHADPTAPRDFTSNWELSLARALSVAGTLTAAGYQGEVVARGYGHSRFAQLAPGLTGEHRLALARRVDIVLYQNTAEPLP